MTDLNDRREAAEAAALEATADWAAACSELRAAVAADPRVQASTVAQLDVHRRFAWARVSDALGYAEASLGWDMPPRDPLFVHSEATQTLYEQYHSRGVALAAGQEVVAARNKMMRAAGAAERAIEDLGIVYDQQLLAPRLYPGARRPLDRMRELHEAVAGPLPQRTGPSRPRNRGLEQRLISRVRSGR